MRIFIKAKPGAKEDKIEKIDENHFVVFVREQPQENKANKAIIKVIAKYFGVDKNSVNIISGLSSKNKVIEIKIWMS